MTPSQRRQLLKSLSTILGGLSVVVMSWFATKFENDGIKTEAQNGAEDFAAQVAFIAEQKTAAAHDLSAEAINECLDAVDDLSEDLQTLQRDFDRLSGAVEALHGHRNVSRRIEALPDPEPAMPAPVAASRVPSYTSIQTE